MSLLLRRVLLVAVPVGILGLGAVGFVAMMASREKPETKSEEPKGLPVYVSSVAKGTVRLEVTTQGEVQAQRTVDMAAQVGGRVVYVSPQLVDGGSVRQGDVVLALDDADYQLAVTRVRAGVASAEQRLARERAEAELAQRDLSDLGIVDASPLARRLPQIAEAEANLSSAKAQLADAELQLARTVVRAPFTGRVSMKSTEVGQIIAPGQTIGRMFATDVVEVPLPLTDSQLGLVGLPLAYNETARAPGPDVELSAIVGGRSVAWSGRIVRTSAQIDARTRQVMAFAQVDDPFGKAAEAGSPLAPGLFVTGRIQGREVDDTLSIPRSALRGKDQVFVAHNEKIDIRTVTVLKASPDNVLITDGLTLDDRVITSSVMGAFDGMKISVINDLPAAATTETAESATQGDAQ